MADASVRVENGPTDMEPDELAERKRQAAIDYHTRELGALRDSLKALNKRGDKDKVANQKRMIAAVEAALAGVKGN